MTRLVLALCLILVAPSSVSAACAWVLWGKETRWATSPDMPAGATEQWTIEEAFPKLADCAAAKGSRLLQWRQAIEKTAAYKVSMRKKGQQVWAIRRGLFSGDIKLGVVMEYKCLPESMALVPGIMKTVGPPEGLVTPHRGHKRPFTLEDVEPGFTAEDLFGSPTGKGGQR